MKIVDIIDHGKNNKLVIRGIPIPEPSGNEILIEVKAAGVNRPDILQRMGMHPPPSGAPHNPGLEISGIITKCGKDVVRYKAGDAVLALVPGGGYSEYCIAHENLSLPIPKNLSFIEAAAIPETFYTVWSNIFDIGELKEGENFLVHGGSSGIGSTAIQIAKAFSANVITTTSSALKCSKCLEIGADLAINYSVDDFVSVIKESTFKEINLTLDMVGGDYTLRNYNVAAQHGRIVQIAFLKGKIIETDIHLMMRKKLKHTGSTLRHQSIEFKSEIAKKLEEKIWPLLEEKRIKPVIYQTFTLDEAESAHKLMTSGEHFGKIILTV